MDDGADNKKAKDRSPAFPFITLEQAIDRARQFYAEEKRGVAPYSRAVLHWKYSLQSSGGLQTAAALKGYGLMLDAGGSGPQRALQLSDLALRIILDQRPDSTERAGFIRRAALSPSIAQEVYLSWPDGLPSVSTLNHFLVLDKKFNEETAKRVVKILFENQQFAGIDASLVSSDNATIEDDAVEAPVILTAKPAVAEKTSALRTVVPTTGMPQTPHMDQWTSDDGSISITIQFSDRPTAEVYSEVSDYAKYRAERLSKLAAVAPKDKAQGPAAGGSEGQP